MKTSRKAIVYIATSLDGYIAGPKGDMSFLSLVEGPDDYGYHEFIRQVDTVIMGRTTYEWVMSQVSEFPHADKQSYILTRSPRPAQGHTTFYTNDPLELLADLKNKPGQNIFIDGGAQTVKTLMPLIDEVIVSVIPVLLGSGTRLWDGIGYCRLDLVSTDSSYATGLVKLHYAVSKR